MSPTETHNPKLVKLRKRKGNREKRPKEKQIQNKVTF